MTRDRSKPETVSLSEEVSSFLLPASIPLFRALINYEKKANTAADERRRRADLYLISRVCVHLTEACAYDTTSQASPALGIDVHLRSV